MPYRRYVLPLILIIALGFIVYSNTLGGKFIWDDNYLIKNNAYIKSWSTIPEVFTKDIGAGARKGYGFYRPFQMISFMLDYSLWGLDAKGYRLTNIVLHILAALALYWLINILYYDWRLSLFTSILFVIHPLQTEAVAYISGRSDPLVLLFMLVCFIFYIKGLQTKSITFYLLMLASYILALLSRETSLILPLLLLLYHYTFGEKLKAKEFFSLVALAVIYIILRFTSLKFLFVYMAQTTTFLQRIPGFFVALTSYLRLMLWPLGLHMEYGNKLFNLSNPQAIIGVFIFLGLLFFLFREKNKRSLVFFSISWFFIGLLPSSNLYPINAYMAEHWLYLPSIGFFLIVAKGLNSLCKSKNLRILGIILAISLAVFYSSRTLIQNSHWREPIIFYQRTLEYAPESFRLHNELGLTYNEMEQYTDAIASLKQALKIKPDYDKAYNNLGMAYQGLGKTEVSIAAYKKAKELNPDYAEPCYNLGNRYKDLGKNQEAVSEYKKAIQLDPNFIKAYNNLGTIYQKIGRAEEAIAVYKKALEIDPYVAQTCFNLSVTYFYEKKYNLAIKYCDRAKELGYTNHKFLELLKPYRKK